MIQKRKCCNLPGLIYLKARLFLASRLFLYLLPCCQEVEFIMTTRESTQTPLIIDPRTEGSLATLFPFS